MNASTKLLLLLLLTVLAIEGAHGQASSFTYQGQLRLSGTPFTGMADLELRLYDQLNDGTQIGSTQSVGDWPVEDGLFQIELDFGATAFDGSDRYLEVTVDGAPLIPRQKVTATPYALLATGLASGSVGGGSIDPTEVQLRVVGTCPAGEYVQEINQDGSVVCGVDDAGSASWSLSGNAGTNASTNFIGTTDAVPFEIRTADARSLRIEPSAETFGGSPITTNTVAGSSANEVLPGVRGATISGGGVPSGGGDPNYFDEAPNRVTDHYGTIGGGYANVAGDDSGNVIDGAFATVGGGLDNIASRFSATVGGGNNNTSSNSFATVGGGVNNTASAFRATVGGGDDNTASGEYATVGGGNVNTASGEYATVGGGQLNIASGFWATVGGGSGNTARGDYSFVVGRRAKNSDASHDGVFIFADSENADFTSTGTNQFLARADGGFGFNTSTIPDNVEAVFQSRSGSNTNVDLYLRPSTHPRGINLAMIPGAGAAQFRIAQYDGSAITDRFFLRENGDIQVTAAAFKPGGGSWSASSDRRLKTGIEPLTGSLDRILSLQGVVFEYTEPDPARRPAGQHIGFIAQDVARVFPNWVGTDESGYLTVGPQGFEALAVEALRELRAEAATVDAGQDRRLGELERENASLQAEVAMLRELIAPQVTKGGQ